MNEGARIDTVTIVDTVAGAEGGGVSEDAPLDRHDAPPCARESVR